jgi:uncharacterized protein (DUF2147 family)
MLTARTFTLTLTAAAAAALGSATAQAASDPTGLWFDHNGRGAVEIAPCDSGNGFCGYVVHIKEAKNNKRCGMQILGNVTSSGGGWIYSPDRGKKYSVELTRLSDDKLRVVGNAGSFFSKTYTWNRAPDDVSRCGETTAKAPVKPKKEVQTAATADEPAPAREKPSKKRSLGQGASSASMALIGAPKKRDTDVAAAQDEAAAEPAPAVAEDNPPAVETEEKAAPKAEQAAATPETSKTEETFDEVPERKCK